MPGLKALLSAAGYGPDRPLKLTLLYNTSEKSPEDRHRRGVDVEEKNLGVDVKLQKPGVEDLHR